MTKEMNILCASDKNFLEPTYVTMWSVIKNHPGIKINFYLFAGDDVDGQDKLQLQSFIESKGSTITYIDVDPEMYNDYVLCEKFPKAAYYRLMAHEYLPKTADRVLYIDVDLIVNQNIYDDFYSMDFNDKYMVVTSHNPNPDYYNMLDSTIVNLESAAKGEFFNSGVLLMNLNKFRENITLEHYDRAYKSCEQAGYQVFYDQGLLNYMYFDKCIYLSSMDYNFRYSIPIQYERRLDKNREYKKAIIHYTGMCQPYKPWDLMLEDEDIEKFGKVPFANKYFYVNYELNEFLKKWWEYAEETPIYESVFGKMKVKQKWFKRNLLDFVLMHNNLVKECEKSGRVVEVKEGKQNNVKLSYNQKVYKVGLIVTAPFRFIKRVLRKIFKRKK